MSVAYNPKIVTDSLVLALDAANPKSYNYNLVTYSQDFQNAVYGKSTGLITATGVLAPDNTLTATTMTDDITGNYENFNRSFTIPNDSSSYNISIFIRKTTGATSTRTGFNVTLSGGTVKNYNVRFNADTGVAVNGDTNLVTSENNNYWRLSFTVSNNGTGNTTLSISYYPATGIYDGGDVATAMGSHTVWGFQITRGAALLPYMLNVNYSDQTWYDLSGKNYNATLIGQNPTPYVSNGAVHLEYDTEVYDTDGVGNDYIRISNTSVSATDAPLTYSLWFNMKSAGRTAQAIWLMGPAGTSATGTGLGFGIKSSNQLWGIAYDEAGNQVQITSPTTLQLDTWYMATVVHDNTNIKIYLNAVYDSQVSCAGFKPSAEAFTIGLNRIYYHFGGKLNNVYVYNRALSAAEIQQNFNAIRGRYGI